MQRKTRREGKRRGGEAGIKNKKFSETEAPIWIKIKSLLCHRDNKAQDINTSRSQWMFLISIFRLNQPIDCDRFGSFRPYLFYQTVSTFSADKWLLQFLVLISGISGYLWLLGTPAVL